jgi:hypothetical protein
MTLEKPYKILFICGSMRESADGIGDYTRRLSGELNRMGHHAVVMAFNDKFVNETYSETQFDGDTPVEVLRLKKSLGHHQKFKALNKLVYDFKPDLISVQYVLYAFNDKGLPFQFALDLRNVSQNTPTEIMFHELWLGMEKKPILKDRIYGVFQKWIIKRMIKRLHPKVIHTHSRSYQKLLKHHNVASQYLPIISNIPIHNQELNAKNDNSNLQLLLFGYISPGAPINEFISEIFAWSQKQGKTLEFLFAGRNGNALKDWISALDSFRISYKVIGVLDITELSDLMSTVSIGIATTPYLLYEKSGSIAAMLKHGLPVLNVAVDWDPEIDIHFEIKENILEYKQGVLNTFFENNFNKRIYSKRLHEVAVQFISDFERSMRT